jgi:hypothetical protein
MVPTLQVRRQQEKKIQKYNQQPIFMSISFFSSSFFSGSFLAMAAVRLSRCMLDLTMLDMMYCACLIPSSRPVMVMNTSLEREKTRYYY